MSREFYEEGIREAEYQAEERSVRYRRQVRDTAESLLGEIGSAHDKAKSLVRLLDSARIAERSSTGHGEVLVRIEERYAPASRRAEKVLEDLKDAYKALKTFQRI